MAKKRSFFSWLRKRGRRRVRELRDLYRLELGNPTVKFEEGVQVINSERLSLGRNIFIAKGTILNCGGGEWCNDGGRISRS